MRANPETAFLFRLALALGEADPWSMERRMSARLFDDWRAYDSIEPIGGWAVQLLLAMIASLIRNAFYKGKRARPADFMPWYEAEKPKDKRSLFANFQSWARSAVRRSKREGE